MSRKEREHYFCTDESDLGGRKHGRKSGRKGRLSLRRREEMGFWAQTGGEWGGWWGECDLSRNRKNLSLVGSKKVEYVGEDSRRLTMWWWEPRISDCFKFLGTSRKNGHEFECRGGIEGSR